jgi:hypothetical protein
MIFILGLTIFMGGVVIGGTIAQFLFSQEEKEKQDNLRKEKLDELLLRLDKALEK